jgi:uncharacterized protein YvpB
MPDQSNDQGFTVQPFDSQGYVSTDAVNIRSVPTTVGNVRLGKLYENTPVTITGKVTTGGDPAEWYQIKYNDGVGYAASTYITLGVPAPATSTTPASTTPASTTPASTTDATSTATHLPNCPDGTLAVPWVSQIINGSGHNACGETSTRMLLGYYGKDNGDSIETMANWLGKWGQDTGVPDLIKLAAHYGVTISQVTHDTTFAVLKDHLANKRPVIILVNYLDLNFPVHLGGGADMGLHWLVVIGYVNGTYYLNDPLWLASQRNGQGGACLPITEDQLGRAVRPNMANFLALA